MSGRRPDSVSEDDARALWARALEMQHEAARRLEERNAERALTAGDRSGDPGEGFHLDDVTAAAKEAGISPEFMELALAEQEVTRKQREWKRKRGNAARRLLRPQTGAIEVSRIMRASPGAVMAALQRVLPANPFGLILEDSRGGDPLQGGTLVFKVPNMQAYTAGATFAMEMYYGTVTHLLVSLREGDGGQETEVILRAPLLEHDRQSYWFGVGFTGVAGLAGGTLGVLAGLGLAATAPLAVAVAAVAAPAVAGAGGLGALSVWGSRVMHRWGIRKSTTALEELLRILDVNARTGGAFPTPAPRPASSDLDLGTFLASGGS